MMRVSHFELLILHPAERQNSSVVRRKDRLDHRQHISDKPLALLSQSHPFPGSLKSGHVAHTVNPWVRQTVGGQGTLGVIT